MSSSGLMKFVAPCWTNSGGEKVGADGCSSGRSDGLLWSKDSGHHVNGEFSMAVVQANSLLEDHSQVESGPLGLGDSGPFGTFAGVYDGHGGPEAARFVADHLFGHIRKFTSDQHGMSANVIRKAFSSTEEGFISLVRNKWPTQLAAVGSCCLIGIICDGLLYVANVGDSRAILGTSRKNARQVTALQLSAEHNASIDSVRDELHVLHPDDPQIVVLKHNVWRVKGIIQCFHLYSGGWFNNISQEETNLPQIRKYRRISRSIGDAYLKNAEFNKEPLLSKFRVPQSFQKPILSAEPSIVTHKLCPQDRFIIFASDGLWEHLSNQDAADIVCSCPRNGIAKKLIKTALLEAAKKREMRYSDLKKIDRGVRRHFHDDITVIVLFLDTNLVSKSFLHGPIVSLRGSGVTRQVLSL